jgi:ABC-2 type transport system permease protein/sodium transport system permease protein
MIGRLPEAEGIPIVPPRPAARLARLARKELRETLRDRRTLITLVLMPFLLYPLLSMILRKFLLAGAVAGGIPTYFVGCESEQDMAFVKDLLSKARAVMATRRRPTPLPDVQLFSSNAAETALSQGEIDVLVRITRRPEAGFQADQSWEVDSELFTLAGSLTGERAARHVEDCFRVFGSVVISARLQSAGIRQRASPIRVTPRQVEGASHASMVSLPALIPFVLILMTITGAVYPAIDLTAGERERGTLELLIAAPVPRLALLFAKYVAVLTVAVLTASINLVSMTGTIALSGLGPMIWGDHGLSVGTVVAVFFLLILLAGFFAAVLLTITSFARSFKEAQAYLIPLMLCALGPGLVSLMPGVELRSWLAVTPLLNVALLARDLLSGKASLIMGTVVVTSTVLYAFAALALAARLFAADAVLYDARLGWTEIWRRPRHAAPPSIALALLCLACMFPVSFAANGTIAALDVEGIQVKLIAMAAATALVFGGVPLLFARWRRIDWATGFQWRRPPAAGLLGAAALGLCLWPFAIVTHEIGLVSLQNEQLERARKLIEECRTVPLWLVLVAFALAPAVFEEFCFRGLVFSAFRSRMNPWPSILGSAALFGVFHLVATDALAIERLLPSTLLGIVLGWTCHRTSSLFPGMVLHSFHNGLLTLMFYYLPQIQAAGWGVQEREHLPWTWLAVAAAGAVAGWLVLCLATRGRLIRNEVVQQPMLVH